MCYDLKEKNNNGSEPNGARNYTPQKKNDEPRILAKCSTQETRHKMSMQLPSVETIRERISKTKQPEAKYCLMSAYLFCARISEVIGQTCPSDMTKTTARGPTPNEVTTDTFELGPIKEEVAVWTIKTAKRKGKERLIALPLNPEYEPYTKELLDYYQSFSKNEHVFPFTQQKATSYSRKVFSGLTYPIDAYKIYANGVVIKETIDHNKPFRTHALRHLRATELLSKYQFTGIDLSVYGGWTLRSMVGVGSSMSRYTHLRWDHYFPKLLKRR